MSPSEGKAGAIAVLGGGAWGTALAQAEALAGRDIRFWARDPATVEGINRTRRNPRFLSGIMLDRRIRATGDLADAAAGVACVLLVTPAQTVAAVSRLLASVLAPDIPVVLCAKGIDAVSGTLLSSVTARNLPQNPVAALSGPSFAVDVVAGLPTAVTIAASDAEVAGALSTLLSTPALRCYSSDDLAGVEAGGALKNVMAIAAGAVAGAGLGASAQAATVTRGFVELRRIAGFFGARSETLMGLSGFGDLFLTCGSGKSRNFTYGLALGRGDPLDDLPLAEGVATAAIADRLAREGGIDAPITRNVALLLDRAITVREAMTALLSRPLKSEF
ncbi:NAD(P)H-dependent glycerol-3-phosphate dehydrogenase [Nitratireductor sp. CAU 1489]|uniref:Glycerol-3-phosphate dehydrogenase [NAD(P)+] n=1 Tax=Nitratireductor arenosus TaxID=2682096 RepID=A0A844Q8X6_9HYPH|nr:NAD(P)H-dependent glycerol-3-phosphate dehydrogenase [Nitratireductor arenosus]MVA96546.1 NAD(P)H-dependent glycerol-3-phosphate dehydrogenase [Nitratireductor arenosus]